MTDPKILDDLARRIADSLPEGLRSLQADVEKNVRAVVEGALGKLNLITREEFDVQTQVLARTRVLLTEMEQRIAELERALAEDESTDENGMNMDGG